MPLLLGSLGVTARRSRTARGFVRCWLSGVAWSLLCALLPCVHVSIAHLNTEDYEAIPQDFINLGFTPEGVSAERLRASGITDGLSFAFRQLSAGGGPAKIAERVESELKERYGVRLHRPRLTSHASPITHHASRPTDYASPFSLVNPSRSRSLALSFALCYERPSTRAMVCSAGRPEQPRAREEGAGGVHRRDGEAAAVGGCRCQGCDCTPSLSPRP
jgi:hypothetical protein